MRIEDLEIFVDVVYFHSMNEAAKKHFMTPQYLSKVIKRIEEEMNLILFYRSKKGSELTEDGEMFYLQTLKVLHEYKKLKHITSEQVVEKNEKNISILCHQGATYFSTIHAYKMMQKNNTAEFQLEIVTRPLNRKKISCKNDIIDNNEIYDLLILNIRGNTNVNTVIDYFQGYLPMNIIRDEAVILVSKMHPLSSRKSIEFNELSSLKFISLKGSYALGNYSPQLLLDSYNDVIEYVAHSNQLCAVVSKSIVNIKNEDGNLASIPFERRIYGNYLILVNEMSVDDVNVKELAKLICDVLSGESV